MKIFFKVIFQTVAVLAASLVVALLIGFSLAVWDRESLAAQPGAVPSVTVSAPGANTGSVNISPSQLSGTGVNGIFSLYGYFGSTGGTNRFYALFRNGGTQYKVGDQTGSYGTVKAYCFDITASAGGASAAFQLVSATATFSNDATSITVTSFPSGFGPYQGGAANAYPSLMSATINVPAIVVGVYTFGPSTYPGLQMAASGFSFQIHMDCYEQ